MSNRGTSLVASSNGGVRARIRVVERRPAFTLLELMIAMVILGLGLVMVATMFPVAWTRAKELNEVTARRTIVPTIESTLKGLVPVSDTKLTRAGFAGDLVYVSECTPGWIAAYSDTRVHAMNAQNVIAGSSGGARGFVAEDPWRLEMMPDIGVWVGDPLNHGHCQERCATLLAVPNVQRDLVDPLRQNSYHTPRFEFAQRWYPPLSPRDPATVDSDGVFQDNPSWDGKLDTRRFAWAVLHRLRKYVGPAAPDTAIPPPLPPCNTPEADIALAQQAAAREREFDIYFVTLRRPRPTDRYARQEYSGTGVLPDPYVLTATAKAVPASRPTSEDLLLPVPWRVQIEVPQAPNVKMAVDATGTPTEVLVPPNNFPGNEASSIMLVQMFPAGTFFIDEINGQVYKVVQRRIVDAVGALAVLTLDREITLEELEIPKHPSGDCDPRFPGPNQCTVVEASKMADPEELLRTVWVFPPPAEPRGTGEAYATFDGPPPVVGIEVRTMIFQP